MNITQALTEKGTNIFYRYRFAYDISRPEGVLRVPAMYQPSLQNDSMPQPTLWDFGLHHMPILEGDLNETLTGMFLDRFAKREIGFTDIEDFERNLRRIFNEQAPMWDARLRSMMVDVPLDDINVNTTNNESSDSTDESTSTTETSDARTRNETTTGERDETTTGSRDETTTGSRDETTTGSRDETSTVTRAGEEHARDVNSDFPSTMIGGDSRYPSGAVDRNANTSGTDTTVSEGADSVTREGADSTVVEGTDSTIVNGTDSGTVNATDSAEGSSTETSSGSSSANRAASTTEEGRRRSVAALLMEQREALINVQEEILDSFETLFAGNLYGAYNGCKHPYIF